MNKYTASRYGFDDSVPRNDKPYGMAYSRYAAYYNVDSAFGNSPEYYYRMAKEKLNAIVELKNEMKELEGIKSLLESQQTITDNFSSDQLDDFVTQIFNTIAGEKATDNMLDNFETNIHQQYGKIQDEGNDNKERLEKLNSFIGEFRGIFNQTGKIEDNLERQSINKFLEKFGKKGVAIDENYKGDLNRVKHALENFYNKLQTVASIYRTNQKDITNFNEYAQKSIAGSNNQRKRAQELHNRGIISDKQYTELNKYFDKGNTLNKDTKLETFSSGKSFKQLMAGCYSVLLGEFYEIGLYAGLKNYDDKLDKEIKKELPNYIITQVDHTGGNPTRAGADIQAAIKLDIKDKEIKDKQGKVVSEISIPIGFNVKAYTKEEQFKGNYKRFINMNFSDWISAATKADLLLQEAIWTFVHIAQLGFNEVGGKKLNKEQQINTYAINAYITSFHYQEIFGLQDNVRYIAFKKEIINIYDFVKKYIMNQNRFPVYQLGRSSKFRALEDFKSAPIAFRALDKGISVE